LIEAVIGDACESLTVKTARYPSGS